MTDTAQRALDASLKIAEVALKASQNKPKDGAPTYKSTPEQQVLSRAARLFQRVVAMNYESQNGEANGLLFNMTIEQAGNTLDSMEWAIDVIELLSGDDGELHVEDATTLQSLIIEAVKAEFASMKSRRGAKTPAVDPARNHLARASEGAVPPKS